MPTDGADFRTNKICFGKAYSYAREGADGVVVAGAVMEGVERYIKFCGGAPAFVVVVDTLVTACRAGFGGERLLQALDEVQSKFADSPLTRDVASAAEVIGLEAMAGIRNLSRQDAAKLILTRLGERHCDGMLDYVVRRRTGNFAAGREDIASYKSMLQRTPEARELAARMLNGSPKGLPARAAKAAPVAHTADGLNEEL